MKQYLCIPCRSWHFDKFCPDCGVPSGAGANAHLYTSKLNNQLYAQAESAEKERRVEQQLRAGHSPEPTREQKKIAKQIVADL